MENSFVICFLFTAGLLKQSRETYALSNNTNRRITQPRENSPSRYFTPDWEIPAAGEIASIDLKNNHPTYKTEQTVAAMTGCLFYLTEKYFRNSRLVALLTDDPNNQIEHDLLERLQITLHSAVMLLSYPRINGSIPSRNGSKNEKRPQEKFSHILMFPSSLDRLSSLLRRLSQEKRWSHYVPLLAAFTSSTSRPSAGYLDKAVLEIWKYSVANAAMVVPEVNSSAAVYSMHPFSGGEVCGRNSGKALPAGLWKLPSDHLVDIFPPKKLSNLSGCPLRIVTFHYPPGTIVSKDADGNITVGGIEGNLMAATASVLNFRPHYRLPLRGHLHGNSLPNGSFDGAVGDIEAGDADIGMASFLATPERLTVVDAEITHSTECLTWAVPYHENEFGLVTFMESIASFEVWTAIGAMLSISCLSSWLLCRWTPAEFRKQRRGFSCCCFEMISGFVGVSLRRPPIRPSIRILFPAVCAAGLVASTAIRSQLVGVMTAPPLPTWPKNVAEILQSKIRIGGSGAMLNIIRNMDTWNSKTLINRYEPVDPKTKVLCEEGWAVPGSRSNLLYELNGDRSKVVQSGCMLTFQRVFLYSKPSALIPEFYRVTLYAVEAGLIDKWSDDSRAPPRFKVKMAKQDQRVKVISLRQMIAAFVVLLGGLCLGSVAFILELCCSNLVKISQPVINTTAEKKNYK